MSNINELIEKYWNAETTLEEEQAIKTYFKKGKIADEHKHLAPLFGYYSKVVNMTAKFEPNVTMKTTTKVISLNVWLRSIAAVAFLAIASFAVVKYMMPVADQNIPIATASGQAKIINIEDPEEAMEYTEDAIMALASVLKISKEELRKGLKTIDNAPVIGQGSNK